MKKLFINANVITVNEKEEIAQALLVVDGKISRVNTVYFG